MSTIQADVIDRFQNGDRLVQVVSEPGVTKVITKEGTVDVPFKPGAVALTRGDGSVICGPIGFEAALDYAERVLEGDQRASTDAAGLQMLATVVVAVSSIPPSLESPPAALTWKGEFADAGGGEPVYRLLGDESGFVLTKLQGSVRWKAFFDSAVAAKDAAQADHDQLRPALATLSEPDHETL